MNTYLEMSSDIKADNRILNMHPHVLKTVISVNKSCVNLDASFTSDVASDSLTSSDSKMDVDDDISVESELPLLVPGMRREDADDPDTVLGTLTGCIDNLNEVLKRQPSPNRLALRHDIGFQMGMVDVRDLLLWIYRTRSVMFRLVKNDVSIWPVVCKYISSDYFVLYDPTLDVTSL